MIARHIILFLLLVVLPDLYIDFCYFRRRNLKLWKRLFWWVPCVIMLVGTSFLASQFDFVPRNYIFLEIYFALLGLLVIPKAVFAICSAAGWGHNLYHGKKQRWGERIGFVLAVGIAGLFIYGFTLGFSRIEVKHIDLSFEELPMQFDGYKIIHISDLHVGSYVGWRRCILERAVDSILMQKPDLVCFTGDLQNARPEEVLAVKDILRRLPGTISVLGNHDHGEYIGGTQEEKNSVEKRLVEIQRKELGWTPLVNNSIEIFRDCYPEKGFQKQVPVFIIGTDNDGQPPFPSLADYQCAVKPWMKKGFSIMLQHDPSAWRRNILPKTTAQLTLSGHTHGGQMNFFGLRPTRLQYREDYGVYKQDGRILHVSGGLGGVVPFRLGIPGEVTLITLHVKKH